MGKQFNLSVTNRMPGIPYLQNFIGGEFVEPSNLEYIDSLNPATGRLLCKVPNSNLADVEAAVQSGLDAAEKWGRVARAERSRLMHRLADLIERDMKGLGKPNEHAIY